VLARTQASTELVLFGDTPNPGTLVAQTWYNFLIDEDVLNC